MAGIIAVVLMCCIVFGGLPFFIAGVTLAITKNFFIAAIIGFVAYFFWIFFRGE